MIGFDEDPMATDENPASARIEALVHREDRFAVSVALASLKPEGSGEFRGDPRIGRPDGAVRCVRGMARPPTRIAGLDEITGIGLPAWRPNHAIFRAESRRLSPWLKDRGSITAAARFS